MYRIFKTKNPAVLAALGLFALIVLTYWNGLHSEFMIDDKLFRTKYYHSGFQHFWDFFIKTPNWHFSPVNFMLNMFLFDHLPDDPFYFHLVNLILFYACVFSFYILISRLTQNNALAFLASGLFTIHPTNTEIVQHIHFDIVLLVALFMSLSLICFLKFFDNPNLKRPYFYWSLFFFVCSLLTSEISILFLLYLGAMLYFMKRVPLIGLFLNKNVMVANISTFSSLEKRPNIDFHNVFVEEKVNKQILKHIFPFLVITLLYLCIQLKVAGKNAHFMIADRDLHLNFFIIVATFFHLIKWHIGNLVWPGSTAFFKHYFPIADPYGLYTALSALLLGLSFFLIFKTWRSDIKSLALAWFLSGFLFMLPAAFVHSPMGLVIEPYWFFFPSLGFFILLASYLLKLRNSLSAQGWTALMAGIAFFFLVHSWTINVYAQKERTYCEYWLASDPGDPIALGTLADEFVADREYLQAISIYEKLLKTDTVKPHFIHEAMGRTYLQMKDYKIAREYFLMSVREGNNDASIKMLSVIDAMESLPKPRSGSQTYKCSVTAAGEMSCDPVAAP